MKNLNSNPELHNLEIFTERCAARALLWCSGYLHLHQAVDELQKYAMQSGLVANIGQDAVQQIMAEAFKARRIRL